MISLKLKCIISTYVSEDKFGFLEGRQIHETIGVEGEGIHSLKTTKLKGVVIKIDLSKAYDHVIWIYIKLILTHVGFFLDFINWVTSCIQSVSFEVVINDTSSPLLYVQHGIWQVFPISPLLFLLATEGLSRLLVEEKLRREFQCYFITRSCAISPLLFVDNILIFCSGFSQEVVVLKNIFSMFGKYIGMIVNFKKYSILAANLRACELQDI